MLRLRLLAVALLALPAAAAETFVLQEPAARAAASAYTADVCKRTPPSCAEAKALEAAYADVLASATGCDQAGCKLEAIRGLTRSLGELDKRDAALALPENSRLQRAFLTLSVIASSRLANAAARLGKPQEGAVYGQSDRTNAQRSLAAFCLESAAHCREMTSFMESEYALGESIKSCAAAKCALEEADPLADRAHGAFSRYFELDKLAKGGTLGVFVLVNGVNTQAVALYSPLADGAVGRLTEGTERLKRNLDLAESNSAVPMSAIEASGPELLESHRLAALASDRLAHFLGYGDRKNGAEARRTAVNAAAIKLSGLRARALALRAARGLGEDKAGPGGVPASEGTAGATLRPAGLVMSEPARTFLDRRLVPAPLGPKAEAPPILPDGPGVLKLLARARSKDPAERADALRRLKLTKTVGDPARYAPQAFPQEGATTCAVAAQVSVLRAHGLLPKSTDPKVQERALAAEAKAQGLMKGGTPPEYTASLLIARGMLVDKRPNSKWPALEAAIRRGSLIQASVDANKLWKLNGPNPLAHSILVTGAELSKSGREILGVYINDTGTDPAGAGKFIPLRDFQAAWFGSFAEVR